MASLARLLLLIVFPLTDAAAAVLLLPKTSLEPHEIGVVINDADPLSRDIGSYYRDRRAIPTDNVVHVRFDVQAELSVERFKALYREVEAQMPASVQAYALAWRQPYRVACMSITAAFATGFDEHFCSRKDAVRRCQVSGASPYFDSNSLAPYDELGLRPAMLLAAMSFDDAKELIDRGVAADETFPTGTAYLLSTSDRSRTVRDQFFAEAKESLSTRLGIQVLRQDSIEARDDVLFYITGLTHVPHLESLTFLPGAIADHLTSAGGHMRPPEASGQMSALRWLEAGATGSYGAVLEPCNFPQKFPHPRLLMQRYLAGASLIEAYWKSVAWPGEGLFIGEPLATPFALRWVPLDAGAAQLPPHALAAGAYRIEHSDYPVGPYRDSGRELAVVDASHSVSITDLAERYARLVRKP
jgi:uncharacterized protein (TIGR03790 family)